MSNTLEVMIVPFQQDASIVIPRGLVEYVLPYAMPLPSSYSHEALVGAIIYQNEKIPILDASILYQGSSPEDSGQRRIIIISCLQAHEEFSSYAVIADSAPRLLEVSQESIQETISEPEAPFHSRIELDQLGNHQLFVLDLEALENTIFE